jgi:hypothetical protein
MMKTQFISENSKQDKKKLNEKSYKRVTDMNDKNAVSTKLLNNNKKDFSDSKHKDKL